MRKALIAEDHPVNRELLRELLEGRGWEVEEACDGEAALGMLERTRPDILLLDLGMPKLDGFGVLSKIRKNAQLADLPVLAVTAFAMRGDREKVLDAGFDGYLSKPINAISLAEELERLLGRPGARRAVPAQAANRLYDGKAGPGNPQSNA